MKTKEELNDLGKGFEELKDKPTELTNEEVEQVMSGIAHGRTYWKNRAVRNNGNATNNDDTNGAN